MNFKQQAGVQALLARQAKPALQKGKCMAQNKSIAFGAAAKAYRNKPLLMSSSWFPIS